MPASRSIPDGAHRPSASEHVHRHPSHRTRPFLPRELPAALGALTDLALDLRWTWCHACDALWREIDPELWERSANPWLLLQEVPAARLEALAGDPGFLAEVRRLAAERQHDLAAPGWFERAHPAALKAAAYFSLEFGFGEGLPLYAGGLGVLAADLLKAASDLGVPVVGIGLLYQEGYFRQMVDASGTQQETYPYNDPLSLPIQPALDAHGGWMHVSLELPGRRLWLRIWRAVAGRTTLYLLDSNDSLNAPVDRGITAKLYGGDAEVRLLQELVLGVGGWRTLEAAGVSAEVCHLNEGHAAFAAIERARRLAVERTISFGEAIWATRAGNVFTTHTPVAAGFDRFPPALIEKYFGTLEVSPLGVSLEALLSLGRRDAADRDEPFNMAWLAMRCCARANGVSRLHGEVSRRLFSELFPRWPLAEIPVVHVTNGVHVPSWDSAHADRLWTSRCGKARWLDALETIGSRIGSVSDEELWALRTEARRELVLRARARLAQQLRQRGVEVPKSDRAAELLDPSALTLGFARRFAAYKRPGLLLSDPERFARLLTRADRPVQIVVAGKAHPADDEGKRLVQAWVAFANRPDVRSRAVFLEDYDIALAQELVAGVDVWVNTPLRPWEACGTSGMKVLVNGGLNLSELDGWWAEAWEPGLGWALGARDGHAERPAEAEHLYRLLEEEVVPSFYDRGTDGIPRAWVAGIRASMARLKPRFSANRMTREYVEQLYLPAAEAFRRRSAGGARLAGELERWQSALEAHWSEVRLIDVEAKAEEGGWRFEARIHSGELPGSSLRAEVYADAPSPGAAPAHIPMERGEALAGSMDAHVWRALVRGGRPVSDFTVRVLPHHPEARVPAEDTHILWQH
jgi:starch phosphorylase